MVRCTTSRSLTRWVAMLAILLKLVLAPGTMLAATPSGGLTVTLCTSDGLASGWIDVDGTLHRDAPGKQHHTDSPCAFSALSAAALGPALVLLPVPPAQTVQPDTTLEPRPGTGLAAPPPPATGPPAIL